MDFAARASSFTAIGMHSLLVVLIDDPMPLQSYLDQNFVLFLQNKILFLKNSTKF